MPRLEVTNVRRKIGKGLESSIHFKTIVFIHPYLHARISMVLYVKLQHYTTLIKKVREPGIVGGFLVVSWTETSLDTL